MVIFMLRDDSLWWKFISKWGPCMFSLKLRPGLVWHWEKNLARVSVSPSIACSLTSRDIHRYWNDYAPGLFSYPDIHLMIEENLENAFYHLPPLDIPSLVLVVFLYLYFLLCGRDRSLAGDESRGGAWGITDRRWFFCLPGSPMKSERVE